MILLMLFSVNKKYSPLIKVTKVHKILLSKYSIHVYSATAQTKL